MPAIKQRLDDYRAEAFHNVFGWVGAKAVDALELVSRYQTNNSISGDALEIGVFQGKFFLALAAAADPGDVVVAVDIFDDQVLNIDLSGQGDDTLSIFKRHVEQYAPNIDAVRMVAADSMTLRATSALKLSPQEGYRLISVDGGHTAEHVMNDLSLASDIIVGGGAVFVDDWMSPHWPGVHEGYLRFMTNQNRNLAPILYTDNKLLMTTISHQPAMVAHLRETFSPWSNQSLAEVTSHGFRFISAA